MAESIVMPVKGEKPNLLIGNLSGLIFVVLGFPPGSVRLPSRVEGYIAAGIVLIAIGAALMVRKIVRRNQGN